MLFGGMPNLAYSDRWRVVEAPDRSDMHMVLLCCKINWWLNPHLFVVMLHGGLP